MLKTLAYATLFSTALVGSSALGEDNPAVPKNRGPGPARSDGCGRDPRAVWHRLRDDARKSAMART